MLPSLQAVQGLAHRAVALRDATSAQIKFEEQHLQVLRNEESLLELVSNLLRQLLDREVSEGIRSVEKLLTEGLTDIFFDQNLSVKIETEDTRGKIGVSISTLCKQEDGTVIEGQSEDSFGGSVTTMQSLLLRIAVIFRRGMRPLLLLDETLSAVADKYVDKAALFLSTLSKHLNLDVLLVSHDEAFVGAAVHAYRIERRGGKVVFRKLSSVEMGAKK